MMFKKRLWIKTLFCRIKKITIFFYARWQENRKKEWLEILNTYQTNHVAHLMFIKLGSKCIVKYP